MVKEHDLVGTIGTCSFGVTVSTCYGYYSMVYSGSGTTVPENPICGLPAVNPSSE